MNKKYIIQGQLTIKIEDADCFEYESYSDDNWVEWCSSYNREKIDIIFNYLYRDPENIHWFFRIIEE